MAGNMHRSLSLFSRIHLNKGFKLREGTEYPLTGGD